MITELNRNAMTVLVVEHDMAFVRQIREDGQRAASRRLFAQGSIDEITKPTSGPGDLPGQGPPWPLSLSSTSAHHGRYGSTPILRGHDLAIQPGDRRRDSAATGSEDHHDAQPDRPATGLAGVDQLNGRESPPCRPSAGRRRGIGYIPQGAKSFRA